MIQGTGKHILTVNVHPNNNESILLDSTTLTISDDGSNDLPATSTPGFEMFLFICSIIIMFFFNKKRRK